MIYRSGPVSHVVRPLAFIGLVTACALVFGHGRSFAEDRRNPSQGPHLRHKPVDGTLKQEWIRQRIERSRMDRTTDLELGGYNESSVAISPVDPDIIAYASLYEMRVSTDGGSTFGPAIQPEWPPTHYAAGDPVVAFDADGRLFWIYLGWTVYDRFLDVFLVQCDPTTGTVLPGYPTNLTALSGLPGPDGHLHDKAWLAIDNWDGSPHRNNIYVAWTDFPSANSNTDVYFSRSTDQGMTWSAVPVVSSSEFTWPTHVAVAPNGDVYCAYHVMGDNWWNRGQVRLFRSTDGGVSLVQTAQPYAQGNAVVNLNIQTRTYPIPGAKFWMQGCFQPWVLPDPVTPGVVSVVVNDDPDDYRWDDPGDVHLVRSTDSGATWSGVVRVDDGPGESHQAMPAASIDRITGNIAVTWYDNRSGAVNAQGDYLLDTFAAVSLDGGLTFEPDFQINDEAFDPDLGASCRLDCGDNHYGVWMESPTNAYVCGDGVHQWDGATWTSINVGAAFPARDVWGFGSADVWIVGEDGNARHWDGVTWATTSTGVTNHLIGIHGRSANDVYAVGYDGTILHWDGVSWTADSSPTTDHLMGVMALPGGTAWCVGYEGTVLHHDGVGWTSSSVGTQEVLVDVWAASDSDVWATGQNGGIYHWDGATWTRMDSGEPKGVWSVWGMSSTDIFFCGWDRVFHWDGSGLAGEKLAAQRFNAVHGIAANAFVTAGHYGKIYRFDGTMWSEEANPGLPTAPTLRIGEYNGVAAGGVFAVATWTGNDENSLGQPVGQQSVFDRFTVDPSATPVPLGNASSIAVLESGTPNPFRWITSVSFSLPRDQQIQCSVFDVRGRLVQELKRARLGAGRHTVTWDGRDESGATVSSGIYLFRMEADGETYSRKLTLVR